MQVLRHPYTPIAYWLPNAPTPATTPWKCGMMALVMSSSVASKSTEK